MSDQFEASIEEAYERGVEAGRLDAVPPNTEPMKWCSRHNSQWLGIDETGSYRRCRFSKNLRPLRVTTCVLEDPVGHWVTVKEGTT